MQAVDHRVAVANDLKSAMQMIAKDPPELILVGHDSQKEEGLKLLHWLRQNVLRIATIVLVKRGGMQSRDALVKLSAAAVLEMPVDRNRLNREIAAALKTACDAAAGPPPLTSEELDGNLSLLENGLNRRMRCVAGQNQVFIQSSLLNSTTTRPRICLRCSLRAEYGMPREVYYEYIRDVCCRDPLQCEAARRFQASRELA